MTTFHTVEELQRVLQREPKHPIYLTQLAALLGQQGQVAEALSAIELAVQQPNCPPIAHQIHGDLLRASGHPQDAAGAYSLAARADPTQPEALFLMGLALEEAGVPQGAKQAFEQVLIRNAEHEGAILGIARLFAQAKQHPEAIRWIEQSPQNSNLRALLASEFLANGEFEKCLTCLEQAPNDPLADSLKIRAQSYNPQADAQSLFHMARDWEAAHCPQNLDRTPPLDPIPERCLRLGFVSSRLHLHNSSIHLCNLLTHRDRGKFKITLFSDTHYLDDFSKRLNDLSDEWHDITKLDSIQSAELVRNQQIDLLVDLHEHSNDNRLQIFGHKPAPIQIHWYANSVTTGLQAIDYRISSSVADPESDDRFSTEKVIRLPNYYLYSPSLAAASTTPKRTTPAKQNNFITFGAIHNLAKYNDEMLTTWKPIFEQLPTAQLFLGRNDFANESTATAFKQRLERAGLPLNRITLEGDQHKIESLEFFNKIDIVLDSWPYNGVASTADGLWMGVPHITLYGNRTAGRRAADQLMLVGHPEWIARTKADYIAKAIELAKDTNRLNKIRSTLHDEFSACPMCDHARTAQDIFGAFRNVWQTACQNI